jgi:hypothetical protein
MTTDAISMLALCTTIVVHLVSTVWWAASVTRRIEHIERWISHHEHTAERLAALEQRIEQFLRDNSGK